jgi:hypothetical protein
MNKTWADKIMDWVIWGDKKEEVEKYSEKYEHNPCPTDFNEVD